MRMDTKVTKCKNNDLSSIDRILECNWAEAARKLSPPVDERILFYAFKSTVSCWLALALLLRADKSTLTLPYGRYRKASKIPPALQYRYFTHAELQSVYFLVLISFFSVGQQDKISRLQDYIEALREMNFSGDIRAALLDIDLLFESDGGASLQKNIDRTRTFLLKNGFSHIRLDFITGQIRLCPITKEFDPSAALYMNQQPQKDLVPQEVESTWIERFGGEDRGFYEIALDKRVNDFHKKVLKQTQNLKIERMVAPETPKHGIIALPKLSTLLADSVVSAALVN
jgi:hypothetical protein